MQAMFATGNPNNPLAWRAHDAPVLTAPGDALVRPLAVAACDLDRAIVQGRSPFPGEFMLGHEFTGEVIQIGEEVTQLAVGDVVLASFQPSCGSCAHCSRGASSVCGAVSNGSMYGIGATGGDWQGALADLIRVPWADYNLKVLPDPADFARLASASDNLADGVRAVAGPLKRQPGAEVLIAGSGSIPLYAILAAQQLGAGNITVASTDDFVLGTAQSLGADCLEVRQWPKRFASHAITVDCTNEVAGLAAVLRSTAPYGESTSCSIYFGGDVAVPMFNMNMRGISFHTGRVNSAADLSAVLELVAGGLAPEKINPAYCSFETAIPTLISEPASRKVIVVR